MTSVAAIHRHMRSLPYAGLEQILQGRTALILAPHPDDESLGCGGLIAAACQKGLPPIVAIVTDGTGSHPSSRQFPPQALQALREREAEEAAGALGLGRERLVFLRLKDTAAPRHGATFDATVAALSSLAISNRCATIFAPWRHDPHGDHEATYFIAEAVARRSGARLVAYPVWGWTLGGDIDLADPLPDGVRLDIHPYLSAKRAAIAAHRSQHGLVVTDAPDGFCLPANLLAAFDVPYEVFLGACR